MRFDKNHGADSAGRLVANDSAFSPRVGVVWDPTGIADLGDDRRASRSTSPAISNSVADFSSAAGNPQTFRFVYRGPSINANGPIDARRRDAIASGLQLVQRQRRRQPSAGGRADHSRRHAGHPGIAGVAQQPRIRDRREPARSATSLPSAPTSCIATSGISTPRFWIPRPAGSRIKFGKTYDLALIQNSNDLARRYSGLTAQGTYRFSARGRYWCQLHAVAHLGQRRRRDRGQRPDDGDGVRTIRSTNRSRGTIRPAICPPTSGIARVCGSTTACRRWRG